MTESRQVQPSISIAAPELGAAERRRVTDVLASGHLSGGPQVDAFGEAFSTYCGVEHAVPTSNGTTALHAALAALDVGRGDTVVTTPFSFVATANAVRHVGAEPVFADVDPDTYNLDPDAVEEILASREDVAAIVAVHLYGLPAAMAELSRLADEYDVALLEDAAQAHGASYRCDPVGSLGDVACFSFYPTKNMTTGEGGAVVTDRADVARAVEQYIDHGRTGDGAHAVVGHNFRMSEIAAAIGRAQLKRLDVYVTARREHAARFDAALSEGDLTPPDVPMGRRHAYNQYTIRCSERERFRSHMRRYGVETAVYYPTPIHQQPAYDDVSTSAPNAERVADEVVSIPVHPNLTDEDVRAICTGLAEWSP